MTLQSKAGLEINKSKFCPVKIRSSKHLKRDRLLNDLSLNSNKKLIIIEGQPGQGKSILVSQFISDKQCKYAWYQVEKNDEDPVLFLISLIFSIYKSLPLFKSVKFDEMLRNNVLSYNDLPSAVSIFLKDLDYFLEHDFFIVFDDIHLCDFFERTIFLLRYFINEASPKIHFIVTSRKQINLGLQKAFLENEVFLLDNIKLAFSLNEVVELYHTVFKQKYSLKQCSTLHKKTEGWIMGLIFARYNKAANFEQIHDASVINTKIMLNYFKNKEHFFQDLSEKLRKTLLKLSLLHEIPISLAERLSEVKDIKKELSVLVKKNYFTRSLSSSDTLFVFHHLFKETLQSFADDQFSKKELYEIRKTTAEFYLKQGDTGNALDYYLTNADYERVEAILENEGLVYLSKNRYLTLFSFLRRIPKKVITKSGLLSLLLGCCHIQENPIEAVFYLKKSNKIFFKKADKKFELLSCAYLIFFYVYMDSNLKSVKKYLPRGEQLYQELEKSLDLITKIFVCQYLAVGFTFAEADTQKSNDYLNIALPLATENNLLNFVAEMRVTKVFNVSSMWKFQEPLAELEKLYPLLFTHKVSIMSKMLIRLAQADTLAKKGSFFDMSYHLELIKEETKNTLVKNSIMGPIFLQISYRHVYCTRRY